MSDITKNKRAKKIADSRRGKITPAWVCQKISEKKKGQKHLNETKLKISQTLQKLNKEKRDAKKKEEELEQSIRVKEERNAETIGNEADAQKPKVQAANEGVMEQWSEEAVIKVHLYRPNESHKRAQVLYSS
ncbi:hypothetical protein [Pseudoalteromonas sp.]|uniref:hypothetical protein n=1 Tax=Pseudoalteromonas sp. TaxID=53249 RepID=UPI002610B084|nr:hypothetical protein [Pseudoalteromonas sp.]MCP4588018.1 hypothetical protein [Pseudoalteromonas sp.]